MFRQTVGELDQNVKSHILFHVKLPSAAVSGGMNSELSEHVRGK